MANRAPGATAAPASGGGAGAASTTTGWAHFTEHFAYQPSKQDIVAVLKSSKLYGKVSEKVSFLSRILGLGDDSLRTLVVAKLSTEDAAAFNKALPLSKTAALKISTAEAAAEAWYVAHDTISRLLADDTKWSTTRATDESKDKLESFAATLCGTINDAKTKVLGDKQAKLKTCVIQLKPHQTPLRAPFCSQGWERPAIQSLRECPYCGHDSIDQPTNLRVVLARNKEKMAKAQKEYDDFKAATESNPNAKRPAAKGGTTTRAPPRLTPKDLEPLIQRCCCMSFRRLRQGDDTGSTCPIQCINPETGMDYGYDAIGHAKCPYCLCNCVAAFQMGKNAEIRLAMEISKGSDGSALQARELSLRTSAAAVGAILRESSVYAHKEVAARLPHQNQAGSSDMLTLQAERAAVQISKTLGQNEHLPYAQTARGTIAPQGLTTLTHLRDGTPVDTRSFGSSRNHRQHQNSLLKNQAKVPAAKRPLLHPYGKRPAKAKVISKKTKTIFNFSSAATKSIGRNGGNDNPFGAVAFTQEMDTDTTVAVGSAAAAAPTGTIDLTGESPAPYTVSSSTSTIGTYGSPLTPVSALKDRATHRLRKSSIRQYTTDVEEGNAKIYDDETTPQKADRKKSKIAFKAVTKDENEATVRTVVSGCQQEGITDSQDIAEQLKEIFNDDED